MFLAEHTGRRDMLRAWARHDADTFRSFVQKMKALGLPCGAATRVLDVGCGLNTPMTLMLHSAGIPVTGIDRQIGHRWGLGFRPARYGRYLKESGLGRTIRKAAGEVVYDRTYYRTLSETLGMRLTEEGLPLVKGDIETLPFESSSFDVVHSNATWEHVSNVRAATVEIARVLKPGGCAYLEMHLFPSLSGGHDLPWIVPGTIKLDGITPWRHLRDRSWTEPVGLNRFRERDYRRVFEGIPGVKIRDWQTEFREGEPFLTDDILSELPDYTAEELTKRSIIVVLQRTASEANTRTGLPRMNRGLAVEVH
jgi:SAM-dependent methyltransferase